MRRRVPSAACAAIVVTLEWIRDRIAHTLDPVTRVTLDKTLGDLGAAVVDHDLGAATDAARALRQVMVGLSEA